MIANPSPPPAPYEREEKTRAERAAELGISARHLRRILAAERRETHDEPAPDDPPYLSLTTAPEAERHEWYDLRSDQTSVDRSGVRSVRVGTRNGARLRVASLVSGVKTEGETKQHQPDPAGLKGGVG